MVSKPPGTPGNAKMLSLSLMTEQLRWKNGIALLDHEGSLDEQMQFFGGKN